MKGNREEGRQVDCQFRETNRQTDRGINIISSTDGSIAGHMNRLTEIGGKGEQRRRSKATEAESRFPTSKQIG